MWLTAKALRPARDVLVSTVTLANGPESPARVFKEIQNFSESLNPPPDDRNHRQHVRLKGEAERGHPPNKGRQRGDTKAESGKRGHPHIGGKRGHPYIGGAG